MFTVLYAYGQVESRMTQASLDDFRSPKKQKWSNQTVRMTCDWCGEGEARAVVGQISGSNQCPSSLRWSLSEGATPKSPPPRVIH